MGKISFNQGPQGDFEPLPEGDCNFSIDEVEEKPAKSADKFPQLMIKMTVVDGPSAGKRATAFFSLSPKAVFRVRELLEATGCTVVSRGKTDAGEEQFDCDTDELLNKYVTFKVRQEEYEGKRNNKFDRPRAFGAAQVSTPSQGGAPRAAAPAQGAKPPATGGYPGRGATPPK